MEQRDTCWMFKILEINLITPEGYSHEIHKDREYRGCPDHFFASNTLKASTEPYNWDFTYNNEYDEYKNKEGNWVNPIKNPYPDRNNNCRCTNPELTD